MRYRRHVERAYGGGGGGVEKGPVRCCEEGRGGLGRRKLGAFQSQIAGRPLAVSLRACATFTKLVAGAVEPYRGWRKYIILLYYCQQNVETKHVKGLTAYDGCD